MSGDVSCHKCHYYRGHPNTVNGAGEVVLFVCSGCSKGFDTSIERAEQRLGA
jgi:hypothetical protein